MAALVAVLAISASSALGAGPFPHNDTEADNWNAVKIEGTAHGIGDPACWQAGSEFYSYDTEKYVKTCPLGGESGSLRLTLNKGGSSTEYDCEATFYGDIDRDGTIDATSRTLEAGTANCSTVQIVNPETWDAQICAYTVGSNVEYWVRQSGYFKWGPKAAEASGSFATYGRLFATLNTSIEFNDVWAGTYFGSTPFGSVYQDGSFDLNPELAVLANEAQSCSWSGLS